MQVSCFQIVLMNDCSRYRSYVMFNYNHIGWNAAKARKTAQGYQSDNSNGLTSISLNFYTTLKKEAYSLASMSGNFG